ncbi:MAG: hypothetical protein KDC54_11480 [Lewinella sp.]|nr:hypothetical protein [Lewinella sp.]
MSCGLQSIERACGPILVGLSTVQIILPADVDTYPLRGLSGLWETDMVLSATATLYSMDFDRGTAGWNQDSQPSDGGDSYTDTVTFRIKKDRAAQVSFLERIRNRAVHLIITDEHGQKRLIMNARLRTRAENGPRGSRNTYNYTFESTSERPTAFLAGEVTTTEGTILISVVLQSPDGNYWSLAVGICGEPIAVSTTSTDVIPGTFRISDTDDATYELTVDNFGTLTVTASAGDAGQIILTAPDGNEYELSVGSCDTLITTLQGSDIPSGAEFGG